MIRADDRPTAARALHHPWLSQAAGMVPSDSADAPRFRTFARTSQPRWVRQTRDVEERLCDQFLAWSGVGGTLTRQDLTDVLLVNSPRARATAEALLAVLGGDADEIHYSQFAAILVPNEDGLALSAFDQFEEHTNSALAAEPCNVALRRKLESPAESTSASETRGKNLSASCRTLPLQVDEASTETCHVDPENGVTAKEPLHGGRRRAHFRSLCTPGGRDTCRKYLKELVSRCKPGLPKSVGRRYTRCKSPSSPQPSKVPQLDVAEEILSPTGSFIRVVQAASQLARESRDANAS